MHGCMTGRLCPCLGVLVALGCATTEPAKPPPAPPPLAWSDPTRAEKLAAAADALRPRVAAFAQKAKVPGMAVGIVADGKLVWFEAAGVRDVRTGAPVDQDSVFRIASMTKAFISAAVLRLRDEGKLSLDDPAEKYLPELRRLAYPTADSPRITVRHLLSHASGLPEDNASADLRMPMADAEFDRMLAAGLSFSTTPGTQYEYSNLAFALAGRLVSRVSGMRAQDYVMRHLLAPLGMTSTRWDAAAVPEEHKVHGYGRKGSAMPSAGLARYEDEAPHEEPTLADGAWAPIGGLWTSPRDYARWVAFQLAAWPPRDGGDEGPVRRASLREAHEVQRSSGFVAERDDGGKLEVAAVGYGLGWGVRSTCRFERVLRHGGGLPGYGSFVVLLPAQGVGFFSMTNLTYTGAASLLMELADGLQERGVLPRREIPLSPQLSRARDSLRDLLASWDAERAAATFDTHYWAYQPREVLEARLAKLRAAHGSCRPGPDAEVENALRGRMELLCERGAISLSVELTSEVPPRIQALVLEPAMPPSPALVDAASRALSLVSRWDDGQAARLLGPEADPAATKKQLRRVAYNRGSCTIRRALSGDGTRNATFRAGCDHGDVDLSVALGPDGQRVSKIEAAPVHGPPGCPP